MSRRHASHGPSGGVWLGILGAPKFKRMGRIKFKYVGVVMLCGALLVCAAYLVIVGIPMEVTARGDVSYWRRRGLNFFFSVHSGSSEWIKCKGQRYHHPNGFDPVFFLSSSDGSITLFSSQIKGRDYLHVNWNGSDRAVLAVPLDTRNGIPDVLGRADPDDYCRIESWDGVVLKLRVKETMGNSDSLVTVDTRTEKMTTVPVNESK